MSTYWFFYCPKCKTRCEQEFNHGDSALLQLLSNAALIKDLQAKLDRVDLDIRVQGDNSYETVQFLKDHEDHEVIVMNEYGEYYKDGVLHEK
jgi:hypothetical protein